MNFHDLPAERRLDLALRAPAPFLLQGGDSLRVSSLNSAAGVTLTVAGRVMTLDGEIRPFAFDHLPATDRTLTHTAQGVGDGWVLNVLVTASVGAPLIGQTWARVQVLRGVEGATVAIAELTRGDVTAVQSLTWPGDVPRRTLDGPGVPRMFTTVNPIAGAEHAIAVSTGARWRILAFSAQLVTDATVADRFATLRASNGTNEVQVGASTVAQAASLTRIYQMGGYGVPSVLASTSIVVPILPHLILRSGDSLLTLTTGLVAGDNWGAGTLFVEEWIDG